MQNLRKKIGQLLMMGFPGCELNENNPVVQWIREGNLGGVLLFDFDVQTGCYGKNLKTVEQIKNLARDLSQCVRPQTNEEQLSLFVAIDYEGGAVDRFASIQGIPSTLKACDQSLMTLEEAEHYFTQMAKTLYELGFNLNFAPVVDLNLNPQSGILGKLGRCFSTDPLIVASMAKQFVDCFSTYGITCAYKHFPGHGSALGDTHHGFVDATETFQTIELEPYRLLLSGLQDHTMIMTAHVINRLLDPSGSPATLSFPMLTDLLRNELGFKGVIISDDLQMKAIAKHYTLEDALCLSLQAGADMLIIANQLDYITASEVIDGIESLINNGRLSLDRVEEAYQRVKRLKQNIDRTPKNDKMTN